MIDEFEIAMLSCGHTVNQYNVLGVCFKCGNKTCGKCLQLLVDDLLCPKCFTNYLKAVEVNG